MKSARSSFRKLLTSKYRFREGVLKDTCVPRCQAAVTSLAAVAVEEEEVVDAMVEAVGTVTATTRGVVVVVVVVAGAVVAGAVTKSRA